MITTSANVDTIQDKLERIVQKEGGSDKGSIQPLGQGFNKSCKLLQSDEVRDDGENEEFTALTWLGGSEKRSTELKFAELCDEDKQEVIDESPDGPYIPVSRMEELLEWMLRLSDDVIRTDQVINVFKNIATRALVFRVGEILLVLIAS